MDVILFGISREIVGKRKLTIDSSENINTVGDLKRWMRSSFPQLRQLSSIAIAVDNEYAEDEQFLTHDNEVAIIPPVSGG